MNRQLKIALLVSLILNVLLAGIILGELPRRLYGSGSGREAFEAQIARLPEPARSRLAATVAEFRKSPLRRQLSEARSNAIRLLVAEPFDEPAYDKQIATFNELRLQISNKMSQDLKAAMKGLPADQREAVARILDRPAGQSR